MNVIVGGVIEKDGKILLVQEAKEKCYKKWNLPAGHLEFNETIMQGAIREIKEETGLDVELTGVLNISNRVLKDDIFMTVVFLAKLINEDIEDIKYDKNEILDVKWYDIDDVIKNMDDKLRDLNFIKQPIINLKNNNIGPINIVNTL